MTTTEVPKPSFWSRALSFAREIWAVLIRPSSIFSLGFLVLAGFVAGVIFWGAFNTALELTNTETFCISCHEMRSNVFEELKTTIHYSFGRPRPLSRLSRSARMDTQNRTQDAGFKRSLGKAFRNDQHARKASEPPAGAGDS